MEVVGGAVASFDEVVADDDVGVPGVEQRLRGAARGSQQGDVSGRDRREVRRQRLDRVGALDQHQPAGFTEAGGHGVDPVGELVVGEPALCGVDRSARAVGAEVEHPGRVHLDGVEQARHPRRI